MASGVSFIQPTFASGEICPNLYARVDLAKYHAGLKLCRNFFILPQGGAANRPGTMFVGRCLNTIAGNSIGGNMPLSTAHLIPFQFNLVQTYMLEFGHLYMRVIMNGGYVLEPTIAISGVTNANPGVITTSTAHGYANGDEAFIAGTQTQLDSTPGRMYLIANSTTYTFTLTDLDGNPINTTNLPPVIGQGNVYYSYGDQRGGQQPPPPPGGGNPVVARVFTLATPYQGTDVQLIKWTQSADTLTLCHPGYPPQDLTRTQHWVWALNEISFAPTISPPTGVSATNDTTGGTQWNYSYVVTAVGNSPPDESLASSPCFMSGPQLNSATGAFNTVQWQGLTSAAYYRVYKANPAVHEAIPSGAWYGYIGTTTGTLFVDSEIAPDFTQTPPLGTSPFTEGPVTAVNVLTGGSGYDANTTLVVNDTTGTGASLVPTISGGVIQSVTIVSGGQNYSNPTIVAGNQGIGAAGHINVTGASSGFDPLAVTAVLTNGGQDYFGKVTVTASGAGSGLTFTPVISSGIITRITVKGTPIGYVDGAALVFTQLGGSGATFDVAVSPPGSSSGSGSLTLAGNYPSCATYFQQRKTFGGSYSNPQTIWMTRPADFKNMDTSNPSQATDAITMTIAATQVNAIKWLIPMNNLVILSSGGAWLLVGGQITQPIAVTPSNSVVVPQNYIGCADLMPIVVNYDILYVQAKGSIVRDLAYNYWVNVYTGNDISVLSSHLFFGHNMERWCYAEQPYYQVWIVRDDGVALSLTYLKEQEVNAWAHHDTPGNSGTDMFLSVASIPEQQIEGLNMDSVYFVTQRTIPGVNGGNPVQYVERMDGRNYLTNGVADVTNAWFVDAGFQYWGSPQTVISGFDHLNGATVSILADGSVSPQQVVVNGSVTLQWAASKVTVGLGYVSQLQTLCMEPEGMTMEVQDYRKAIDAVTVRVTETRGLKVGPQFDDLTEIKERSVSNYMGVAIPLFTGDERIVIDKRYETDDDVCIQQDNPLPCTILGVVPDVVIGK
jgi:hypothetical protein